MARNTMRRLILGVMLSAVVSAQATNTETRSLRDILTECRCLIPSMPPALLAISVRDYQRHVDADGFVIAFWQSETASRFDVIVGNRLRGSWKHAEYATAEPVGDPRSWRGPIWSVQRTGPFVLVGLRVAIDGIATSILTPDLDRVGVTYGVVLGVLPGGVVVYQHAQPHFAPTHYARVASLDTHTGQERDIYPPKPYDAVRRAAIRRERERYAKLGEGWCRENNQHCDAELFDSDLASTEIVVNSRRRAFAFGVEYGSGVEVIAACTGLNKLDDVVCHETALSAWEQAFPSENRASLLRRAAMNPLRIPWR